MKLLYFSIRHSASFITVFWLLILATPFHQVMGGDSVSIYVSNSGLNNIVRFDSPGQGSVFASGSSGSAFLATPYGLAFDSSGSLYVANNVGVPPEILKINSQGNLSLFATSANDYATGLAIDAGNNVYVANSHSGTVEKYSPDGVGTAFASGLGFATGLAFDGSGNLYAANTGGQIWRIDAQGNKTLFASGGLLASPYGLAFDLQGNLYVANRAGGSIEEFNAAGQGTLFATGLNFPEGLAFDSSGNLYVANYGNGSSSIEVLDPQGNGTVYASSGLFGPTFIAIQEIPEPSFFAVTMFGLRFILQRIRIEQGCKS